MTTWFVALNTFHPGAPVGYTVLSSHRSLEAAERACRAAQPRERGSYLPVTIGRSDHRLARGRVVDVAELADVETSWSL